MLNVDQMLIVTTAAAEKYFDRS